MIDVTELIAALKHYPEGYMITTHDYEPYLVVCNEIGKEVDRIGVGD